MGDRGNKKIILRIDNTNSRTIKTRAYLINDYKELPPLSMEYYAFTMKQINKKKKSILNSIKSAEAIMSIELGLNIK